jgi:hypothetical protein
MQKVDGCGRRFVTDLRVARGACHVTIPNLELVHLQPKPPSRFASVYIDQLSLFSALSCSLDSFRIILLLYIV